MSTSPSKPARRVWRWMQRIEYCRHRAEIAEGLANAGSGSVTFRCEMARVGKEWRDLACQIERSARLLSALESRR
jgi:hypothetical protein